MNYVREVMLYVCILCNKECKVQDLITGKAT